jgi:dephospho-CoA kinase
MKVIIGMTANNSNDNLMIYGVTGGIASGKSTVSKIFEEKYGFALISADELARKAVRPKSEGLMKIADSFGIDILHEDGTLNRKKLGQIIFHDEVLRKELNMIVHPIVNTLYEIEKKKYIEKEINKIIFECPLLIEEGWTSKVNHVILVVADREERIKRIIGRDNILREEAEKKINSQLSDEEKIKSSDYIIYNEGDIHELEQAVKQFLLLND